MLIMSQELFLHEEPENVLPDDVEPVPHVQEEHGSGRARRQGIIETFFPVNKSFSSKPLASY